MADKVAANFRSLFEFDSLLMRHQSTEKSKTQSLQTNKLIENFTTASYTFGFLTLPNEKDSRMPISIWLNCSYTITVIEQLLRVEDKSLFGQLTLKQIDLLSNIVKQAALYGVNSNSEAVRKCCLRLLASLLSPSDADPRNVLDLDMFYLLVCLCLSMPNLYADSVSEKRAKSCTTYGLFGGLNDLNIFKVIVNWFIFWSLKKSSKIFQILTF